MDYKVPGKNINKTGRAILKAIDHHFASTVKCPLGAVQGKLFGFIAAHPGVTASDIQESFEINKSTTSDLINALVGKGMISYEKDPNDNRKRLISLTEKGKEHRDDFLKSSIAFEEKLCKNLTDSELKELNRLLEIVRNNAEGNE